MITIGTFKVAISLRMVGDNDDSPHEVARMLEKAAQRIRSHEWGPDCAHKLVDSNGNQRGTIAIEGTCDAVLPVAQMYLLVNTFLAGPQDRGQILSRHRTAAAAFGAQARHQRAVKRANGAASYLPTAVYRAAPGQIARHAQWVPMGAGIQAVYGDDISTPTGDHQ